MENQLSTIRANFGFSQEQLAEKMGKDVSTISRWERGKTREPLLAPLVNVTNRKYQYVKHMLSSDVVEHVTSSPDISALFYGHDLMIVAIGKEALRRYPLLRATYGFSVVSYFKGEARQVYEENLENMRRAFDTPGSSAICYAPPRSGLIIKDGLIIDFGFVGQNLVHADARLMTEQELVENTKPKIEYRFG